MCVFGQKNAKITILEGKTSLKRSFFNSVNEKLRFGSGIIPRVTIRFFCKKIRKHDDFRRLNVSKTVIFAFFFAKNAYSDSLHDPGPKSKFFVNGIQK